jgi:hypothetical protein
MQSEIAPWAFVFAVPYINKSAQYFRDVLGVRELDIMRLVLIASLSLGSMVAAHSEPGHTATFCLRSQDAKQVCFVGHQEAVLSPMEFEAQQRVLRAELERRAAEARASQVK